MHRCIGFAVVLLLAPLAFAAREGGPIPVQLPLFPGNNWWNTDITNAPVDPNSANFIAFITQPYANQVRRVRCDWGGDVGDGSGEIYGIPFIIVDDSQATTTPTFVAYDSESDHVPYPIPDEAITQFGWIEGGEPGNQDVLGDRHMLIVNRDHNTLFEMGNMLYNGAWRASGGAFFDMKTNNRRPDGWTSADAAGLAILPGLVRYDEANDLPEINHAFRVTVRSTNSPYVFPASHQAGTTAGALPMGARLRLKSTVNPAGVTNPIAVKLLKALKRYGLIVADNGSDMFITGAYDTRWDLNSLIGTLNNSTQGLGAVQASDFEVVQLGWQPPAVLLVTGPLSGGTSQNITVKAVDTSGTVVAGYTGTVRFSSVPAGAVLPANYTFTAGDAGQHTFAVSSLPAGYTTVTATDTAPSSTITGSVLLSNGPQRPTGLEAKVTGTTQVTLTWEPSPGATSYLVQRRTPTTSYGTISCTVGGTTILTCQDLNAPASAAYVYQVCANSVSNTSCSLPDIATNFTFTDDPIVPRTTKVRGVHITELQTVANLMLASPQSFTPVTSNGGKVQAVQLQEISDALDLARNNLGLPPYRRHDAVYNTTVTVKAPNVQELRDGTK